MDPRKDMEIPKFGSVHKNKIIFDHNLENWLGQMLNDCVMLHRNFAIVDNCPLLANSTSEEKMH